MVDQTWPPADLMNAALVGWAGQYGAMSPALTPAATAESPGLLAPPPDAWGAPPLLHAPSASIAAARAPVAGRTARDLDLRMGISSTCPISFLMRVVQKGV
jgi:hypothetical protein